MYKKLISKINEYKNICIYRHIRPDGDACFSQFAMYHFIKDNFKGKNVYMCGKEEYDLLPYSNQVDDSIIEKSLIIVVDTASSERVDDLSYKKGDYVIKIDHHPNLDPYANINYVDETCASTTQLLAKIFLSKDFKNYKVSNNTAMYLYSGILTDSNCFSTSNTTPETLFYASKLTEIGGFDIPALNNYLFDIDLQRYKSITKLRNNLVIKKGVGYIIADKELLNSLKMNASDAKNAIDELNHIKGLNIWAIFGYNTKSGLFDASVRSNSKYIINTTCAKYNGGGHKNACGIKNLTLKQCKQLINDLVKISNE